MMDNHSRLVANMNRRSFLGAAAAAPVAGSQTDRPRGAILGVGNRGAYHVEAFKEHGAIVAAVCDVYEPHLQRAVSLASPGAKGYEDYRRVLEDKSLDFVVVSAPDHWHARMAVDAMEAGKDVYLEKPIAHTIDEGYEVMDTARRLKRVVQVGTQRRSKHRLSRGVEADGRRRDGPGAAGGFLVAQPRGEAQGRTPRR